MRVYVHVHVSICCKAVFPNFSETVHFARINVSIFLRSMSLGVRTFQCAKDSVLKIYSGKYILFLRVYCL